MKNLLLTFAFLITTLMSFGQVSSGNYYNVSLSLTNQNMDVPGARAYNGAKMKFWKNNGHDAQRFRFISAGGGKYYIVSKLKPNLCLTLTTYGNAAGVFMKPFQRTSRNQWRIQSAGGGKYYIIHASSGKYLSWIWGNALGVYQRQGAKTQGWKFKYAGKVKTTEGRTGRPGPCNTQNCKNLRLAVNKTFGSGELKKLKIFNHEFNIKAARVSSVGSSKIIKGRISHHLSYAKDDQIDYEIIISGDKYRFNTNIKQGGIRKITKPIAQGIAGILGAALGGRAGCWLGSVAGGYMANWPGAVVGCFVGTPIGGIAGRTAGKYAGGWLNDTIGRRLGQQIHGKWENAANAIVEAIAVEGVVRY